MIAIADLTKSFSFENGSLAVLGGIDLEVATGEVVAIIGPSGCGKSTLVRICSGLDQSDTGNVKIDGSDAGTGISVAFQDHGLLEWLSIKDNIALGCKLRGVSLDHSYLDDLIVRVGLEGFEGAFPDQLSGGMKSRAALARALAVPSSVVLLDEPFRSLDEVTRFKVSRDATTLLRSRRQTVLFVTHSVSEAVRLADRVVVVSDRPMHVVKEFEISLDDTERQEPDSRAVRTLSERIYSRLSKSAL